MWYYITVFHHVSDIDECESASPPTCESPKICINTRGGYQCVCDGTRYGDECQYSKLKILNGSTCRENAFLPSTVSPARLYCTVRDVRRNGMCELFTSQLPTELQCALFRLDCLGFPAGCV